MSEKLLPCPFCGGTNVAAMSAADDYGTFDWKVYCDDCDAFHETEAEAIAAWNRRAVPTAKEESMFDDVMMTLLICKDDWLEWREKLAEFNLTRLPAPNRFPVVAALIVADWGMQDLEPRYMYVDHIMTDCRARAPQSPLSSNFG